jgi:large subunit ribosomal protein L17e
MVRYSKDPEDQTKMVKARVNQIPTHFKNMLATAAMIKNRDLKGAQKYLQDVIDKKQAVAFRKFRGGGGHGHNAQGKNLRTCTSGWPLKSAKYLLDLLTNAEANAEFKGLDIDNCFIYHIQVNEAVKTRRRTYRAHGRIGPYQSYPCHVEMLVAEKNSIVEKAKETREFTKISRKQAARKRQVTVGGGLE